MAALADRWLVLAHMISPNLVAALGVPHAPVAAATVGLIEAEERTAGECLREALAQLRLSPGARADVAVRIGPAIVGLAEVAEDLHADAIVVGAHRRGPVREVVLGSLWRGAGTVVPVPRDRGRRRLRCRSPRTRWATQVGPPLPRRPRSPPWPPSPIIDPDALHRRRSHCPASDRGDGGVASIVRQRGGLDVSTYRGGGCTRSTRQGAVGWSAVAHVPVASALTSIVPRFDTAKTASWSLLGVLRPVAGAVPVAVRAAAIEGSRRHRRGT